MTSQATTSLSLEIRSILGSPDRSFVPPEGDPALRTGTLATDSERYILEGCASAYDRAVEVLNSFMSRATAIDRDKRLSPIGRLDALRDAASEAIDEAAERIPANFAARAELAAEQAQSAIERETNNESQFPALSWADRFAVLDRFRNIAGDTELYSEIYDAIDDPDGAAAAAAVLGLPSRFLPIDADRLAELRLKLAAEVNPQAARRLSLFSDAAAFARRMEQAAIDAVRSHSGGQHDRPEPGEPVSDPLAEI